MTQHQPTDVRTATLLDVAAGTGLVAAEGQRLIGPSGRLLALDPSPGMLAELRKKLDVETIEAYAESIPLPDNHVDFVSMGYALRHVGDLDQAFGYVHAVALSFDGHREGGALHDGGQ